MRYQYYPISKDDAAEFTEEHHRHSKPLKRHKFSIGGFVGGSQDMELVGLVTVNNCSSRWARDATKDWTGIRLLDQGWTSDDWYGPNKTRIEVVRCVTKEGHPNLCSFLYSKAIKSCFAMGYEEVVTYTRKYESGTSLKAVGFKRHPWIENPNVNTWIIERNKL